jgi:serine/threonine protein kinase/tetratricopeptide (TPR) repeat protein
VNVLDRLQAALPDRYHLERELGRGGMATVYLADDLKHHRKVALKVLKPELAATLGVERFLREIELSARLTHPHILPLHDSGNADGLLYYVMPYVEGESLRSRLVREKQLPVGEAVQIAREVADALGYAHAHGVVHRDIKPENVLLQSGHAVVADFGIARAVSVAGASHLTETGLAVGTPAYMSPEQASGEPDVDGRSDLYSLGCVLYEMLSGETPYTGVTPQAILAKKLTEPVPRVTVVRETVPVGVEAALVRALAKLPVDRFATTQQFSQALAVTSADQGIAAAAGVPRAAHRSKVWRRGAWATLVVLLGVAGWWGAHQVRHPGIRRLAVLPLASFTNDSTKAYFAEGVHDALIFELQQAGIRVLGRTSVLQYAHTEKPIHEIARELGVDGIIEGSLRRSGDSVQLALRLIDARTEETRWQASYPGDVGSMLALYHGVTQGIAGEIRSTLSPQVSARLPSARSVDPQVYDDYLQGQFYFHRLNPGDLDHAFEYFQRALQRDSTYAPAWAGISLVWAARNVTGAARPDEAISRSIAAARRALELDSTLAEVQYPAALALWQNWDWAGTERAFRRALEINPSYADARAYYSHYLHIMKRPREARAQMDSALSLDPLNALIHGLNGVELLDQGSAFEALDEFQKALDGGNIPMGMNVVQALAQAGRPEEALGEMRRILFAGDPEALGALSSGYEAGGFREAMRRLADLSAGRPSAMTGGPFVVADWYALAGDADRTIEWVNRAVESRDANAAYVGEWADFAFVREDPRFQSLLRQMGLPT